MGIVYQAEDVVLQRPVAYKVLPDAVREDPRALEDFLREARIAASLHHPNIVTILTRVDGRRRIRIRRVALQDILARCAPALPGPSQAPKPAHASQQIVHQT
jgi:hypothetical protein